MNRDGDIVPAANAVARAFEVGPGAGHEMQVAAFRREEFGAGETDAFRGAGNEHGLSGQTQVHWLGSPSLVAIRFREGNTG